MARNGSGTFVTPNTFVADTPIIAADHNENWADAASEITNSLALDGQSTMTGQIKAANGTSGAPGISFGADSDLGLFRAASNTLGINASSGVEINGVPINYGGFFARRFSEADQTGITPGTIVKVQLDEDGDLDTNSIYDDTTNFRYTPLKSGWYNIVLSVTGVSGADAFIQALIYKNGSVEAQGSYVSSVDTGTGPTESTSVASKLISMNGTTDYIEAFAFVPDTSIDGGDEKTYMYGWRVF